MDKKQTQGRVFTICIPWVDRLDYALKLLHIYNGFLRAESSKDIIKDRHINLLAFYMIYGYSSSTRERFSKIYGKRMEYVSVLDSELVKLGFLKDFGKSVKSRDLRVELSRMKRFFVDEPGEFDGSHVMLLRFSHV